MRKGFTLTEVLIVISIIAFLVTVATIFLRPQLLKAYDGRRKAEIKRISTALEEYEKDANCYPQAATVSCNPGTGLRPYLDKIPCDPVSKQSYYYEFPAGACPRWYRIYSKLQNDKDQDYQPGIGPGGSYNYVYSSSNAP